MFGALAVYSSFSYYISIKSVRISADRVCASAPFPCLSVLRWCMFNVETVRLYCLPYKNKMKTIFVSSNKKLQDCAQLRYRLATSLYYLTFITLQSFPLIYYSAFITLQSLHCIHFITFDILYISHFIHQIALCCNWQRCMCLYISVGSLGPIRSIHWSTLPQP